MNNLTLVHHLLVSMSVRFNTGQDATMGGVEVSKGGQWYGICETNFEYNAALVVCRSINLAFVDAQVKPGSAFGSLSERIGFSEVHCNGNETELSECDLDFNSTCSTGYYASVFCSNTTLEENDFQVRIGIDRFASDTYGNVEVRVNGIWGRICLHGFDDRDAAVVCRSLGSEDGVAYQHVAENDKAIVMRDVECKGNETSLSQCTNKMMSPDIQTCNDDSGDAGVICFNNTDNSGFGYRLTGGDDSSSGRVEIGYSGRWGIVCAKAWFSADARVFCRSLGYKDGIVEYTINKSLPFRTPWVNGFFCQGVEASLMTCLNTGFNVSSVKANFCLGDEELGAYASCFNNTLEPTNVRLADGPNAYSGRVEVYVTGVNKWGTICDDYWDVDDAVVVCKQLGLYGGTPLRKAPYGPGTGPIWFDNMKCKGNESTLFECSHRGIGTHNCNHTEDVGVVCLAPTATTELSGTSTTPRTTLSTLPITSRLVTQTYKSSSATDSINTPASVKTFTNSTLITRPAIEITTKSSAVIQPTTELTETTEKTPPPVTQTTRTPDETTEQIIITTSSRPSTRDNVPKSSDVAIAVSVTVILLCIITITLMILLFKRRRKQPSGYSRDCFDDYVVSYCSVGTTCASDHLYELNSHRNSDISESSFDIVDGKMMLERNGNAYYSRGISNFESKSESFANPLYGVTKEAEYDKR